MFAVHLSDLGTDRHCHVNGKVEVSKIQAGQRSEHTCESILEFKTLVDATTGTPTVHLVSWLVGVAVSTTDSESVDRGSNPRRALGVLRFEARNMTLRESF